MAEQVGFVGLGLMGSRMAANLIAGGHDVLLYNRTVAKAEILAGAGATVATTAQEVGQQAQTVFMMLTGPDAIEAILWGEQGLVNEKSRCNIIVNMSTVPPAYNRELAHRLQEKGITLLEAPVSGSTDAAAAGSLVILTGGDPAQLESVTAYLMSMAKKLVHCGDVGQATSMKMVINMLLGTMLSGLGEAVTLGEKCGFTTAQVLDTILAGPLGCGFYQAKADMFKKGDYSAGFPIKHMLKDLNFINKTADDAGANTPLAGTVKELYEKAMGLGLADQDFAAVKKVFES
ncbi:MAG: NAD(P)-dependent oxidoreductase [Thermodesulfobacteriota bacterium]